MHDFKLTCEQFLAATREHFFTNDETSDLQAIVPDDDSAGPGGETRHRLHAGG